jgi:hypothetical protein
LTNVGTVRSRSRLTGGGTRWTRTDTTFNSDNLPTQVDDLGDESTAADDTCSRTWYARNGTTWILDRAKRTESVGVNCSTTATLPGDMLSSTRMTYDLETNDWNTYLPVKGVGLVEFRSDSVPSGWRGSPVCIDGRGDRSWSQRAVSRTISWVCGRTGNPSRRSSSPGWNRARWPDATGKA